jgi:LAO/AO transport system kinase
MASNVGDMDVFFRSMSARGTLGGLSTATTDAVKALDAFGKDKIIIETVGAGQNEIDIVKSADTVAVLVPPGSGDDVQMLKAGILEIGDVFVVNKADLKGADRTVQELREMVHMQQDNTANLATGHHGADAIPDSGDGDADEAGDESEETDTWEPAIVETVAKNGEGVEELIETLADHHEFLETSGLLEEKAQMRYAEEIRNLLRDDVGDLLAGEIERRGGMDELVEGVVARETDPYSVADRIIDPIEDCVEDRE